MIQRIKIDLFDKSTHISNGRIKEWTFSIQHSLLATGEHHLPWSFVEEQRSTAMTF